MVFLHYGTHRMNKSQLLEQLSNKFKHLPFREVEKLFEKIILTFADSLASGERIEIRDFGSFSIRHREKRKARNPKTGKEITVEAKKLIYFRSSKNLKSIINEK
ncbi:MAG: integration host factor subunit beta [Rickettsiales bacterium]|nr:integration host factor subunit beta [Rickettsiales bacterium]